MNEAVRDGRKSFGLNRFFAFAIMMVWGVSSSSGTIGITSLPSDTVNTYDGDSFVDSARFIAKTFQTSATSPTMTQARLHLNPTGTPALALNIYGLDGSDKPDISGGVVAGFNGTPTSAFSGIGEYTFLCNSNCDQLAPSTKYALVLSDPASGTSWGFDSSSPVFSSDIGWTELVGFYSTTDSGGTWANITGFSALGAIDVVPEARTYAMIFGLVALGYVAVRRRTKK